MILMSKKHALFSLIIAFIFLLLGELLLGYYFFRFRDASFHPFINMETVVEYTLRINSSKKTVNADPSPPLLSKISNKPSSRSQENEFRKYDVITGRSYHPIIDYSGVFGLYSNRTDLDYFGFRNEVDYYNLKNRTFKLVVMTGSDEVAGYNHKTTISKSLERFLNQNSQAKIAYKVINLGMNGYSLSNELNAYLALVYDLKPEYVVSHGGWSSMVNSQNIPREFKHLGLSYHENQVAWLQNLYGLSDTIQKKILAFGKSGNELIVPAHLKNIQKFKIIVESNNGNFIVGVQGLDFKSVKNENYKDEGKYDDAFHLLKKLREELNGQNNFVDFSKFKMLKYPDGIHSTEESSREIARIYSEIILEKETPNDKVD
jgi:hypothetical protein